MIREALKTGSLHVALLAEGVDRNTKTIAEGWERVKVALLAEGVDRNTSALRLSEQGVRSPSSRRAWIEISSPSHVSTFRQVALLAEGVDRNFI